MARSVRTMGVSARSAAVPPPAPLRGHFFVRRTQKRSGGASARALTLAELLGHFFAKLDRTSRRVFDGVDEGRSKAARLQGVKASDRGPTGARHHVLQPSGMLPRIEQQLRRAIDRLSGEQERRLAV